MMRFYVGKTTAIMRRVSDAVKKQVLWGDWLEVEHEDRDPRLYFVKWRKWDARTSRPVEEEYTIAKSDCMSAPLLEMVFIDVGQGDGCVLSVPDGQASKIIVVDAGEAHNMHGYLKWRRYNVDKVPRLHAAIITHPDADHYRGFQNIFDDSRFEFDHVYHNGLVERAGPDAKDNIGRREQGFCVEVCETQQQAHDLLSDAAARGSMLYPNLLWTALSQPARFGEVRMMGVDHDAAASAVLPGFDGAAPGSARIEVLGPVVERDGGVARLRQFGERPGDGGFNKGKTKNGHSILLRLTYGNLKVIFGGDLNRPSEDFLLRHYGGIDDVSPLPEAIAEARKRFGADILKCCHHGSADVTDEFLEAVSPFGFVVSSGDEESHVHPRPEILGLLGKKGRSDRPMILCTEILRSTPESRRYSPDERKKLAALEAAVAAAEAKDRKAAQKAVRDFHDRRYRRLVNVYGAINIRTDGQRLVVAFLKEIGTPTSRWQTYEYHFDGNDWVGGTEKGAGKRKEQTH
ncbi:MAG: hypothetical protein KF914_02580 [Rhizobiaceae bacterium]|nr:hypothetical protein [Rhizobiaceae bacterium]